ncbi:MAG TPA: hypothetical protein VKY92_08470 [Verrucomicrobiae bacterium]|nr:hypothetical protein [Verrucomicrobiae bacterium]
MKAFEVHLNGKRVCIAGVGEFGVLTGIVSWRGMQPYKDGTVPSADSLQLQVSGLTNPSGKKVGWTERDIRVGDRIEIRVIDASAVDSPVET